jgi:DnaD/phage-associated family protein
MTPEDKFFCLYLLTNPHTTQSGLYKITKKQMAFDLGYSIESVHSLMERFIHHHKLIRYNPETRELAIKNWGKDNLHKGGKPVMDCIYSELKDVEDTSLITYVAEAIQKQEIEKQQQEAFKPKIENNPETVNHQKTEDVKEIVEFWDDIGFGFSNMNAKQQLLSWLDDSSFLQPKEVMINAMNIACANNKRRLGYVVGILKNWENDSLLTVEEIDTFFESQNSVPKHRQSTESFPAGRAIPGEFVLDLTAGED